MRCCWTVPQCASWHFQDNVGFGAAEDAVTSRTFESHERCVWGLKRLRVMNAKYVG
jgi:hypothetical protein